MKFRCLRLINYATSVIFQKTLSYEKQSDRNIIQIEIKQKQAGIQLIKSVLTTEFHYLVEILVDVKFVVRNFNNFRQNISMVIKKPCILIE
jgi:hypothetical protein